MCGNRYVPIGTPSAPGITKTKTRRHRIVRQIIGSVCNCETTEQRMTKVAATVGGMA